MKTNKEIFALIKQKEKQARKNIAFIGIAIGVGVYIAILVGLFIGSSPDTQAYIVAQTVTCFLFGKKIGHKYYSIKRWLSGE